VLLRMLFLVEVGLVLDSVDRNLLAFFFSMILFSSLVDEFLSRGGVRQGALFGLHVIG